MSLAFAELKYSLHDRYNRERVYKAKLREWRYFKNVRKEEYDVIKKKSRRAKAEGRRNLEFRVHGVLVPQGKIERHCREDTSLDPDDTGESNPHIRYIIVVLADWEQKPISGTLNLQRHHG